MKAHPADPVLHNFAGVIAAQQGAFESAEAHFQTAIRLAPKGPAAYENLGRLYQERADGNPAMRAKAIAIYRRLLDVEPGSVEALFQSGFLLALDGQFAASRAMLERLPEDDPATPAGAGGPCRRPGRPGRRGDGTRGSSMRWRRIRR